MRDELLALRSRLEELRREGKFDEDVDAAYWTADRALAAWGGMGPALDYAREVVARYDPATRAKLKLSVRGISKEEHDAMVGERPKIMTRDEYERMMREAQE